MAGAPDPTTVLERSSHLLEGRVWVCGCPSAEAALRLVDLAPDISFFGQEVTTHRALQAAGFAAELAAWPTSPSSSFDTAVLYLPKGKERLALWLAAARARLAPGGRVLLTGPKKGGIKSAGSSLERAGLVALERVDSARHCSLLKATSPEPGSLCLDDFRVCWSLPASLGGLSIVSYPGVFNHGGLDDGTGLLLQALSAPGQQRHLDLVERALDIGSGAGVIGAWLASRTGADVTCVDADAVAAHASAETLAANNLSRAEAVCGDVWEEASGRYELVVSNPPFHRGLGTDYSVPERIIDGAAGFLATKGQLVLVANSFLPFPARIQEHLGNCRSLEETGRYRVMAATMTRRARQQHRGRLRSEGH